MDCGGITRHESDAADSLTMLRMPRTSRVVEERRGEGVRAFALDGDELDIGWWPAEKRACSGPRAHVKSQR